MVYGLVKFRKKEDTVLKDYKLLVSICQEPLSKAPKRLQNILLRAQQYNYVLRYKPGKEIPVANALSSAPTSKPEMEELLNVNNLTMEPIQDYKLAQIRYNTVEDPTMRLLAEVITKVWGDNKKNLI